MFRKFLSSFNSIKLVSNSILPSIQNRYASSCVTNENPKILITGKYWIDLKTTVLQVSIWNGPYEYLKSGELVIVNICIFAFCRWFGPTWNWMCEIIAKQIRCWFGHSIGHYQAKSNIGSRWTIHFCGYFGFQSKRMAAQRIRQKIITSAPIVVKKSFPYHVDWPIVFIIFFLHSHVQVEIALF